MRADDLRHERRIHGCFNRAFGCGGEREEEDDAPPDDPANALVWVERQKRRLKKLRELEQRFIATHDATLLEDFWPARTFHQAELAENIEGPVALFDAAGFLADGEKHGFQADKRLRNRNADAQELFPGIEIREVRTVDGQVLLAYIGVSTKMLGAALELRHEQEMLTLAINSFKSQDRERWSGSPRSHSKGSAGTARDRGR